MAFKIKFKQIRSSAESAADGGGGATPQNSPRQGPLPSPRRSPSPSHDEGGNTKLFVGNISRDIQDYHVEGLFSQIWEIAQRVYEGESRLCVQDVKRNFGFVEFSDPRDAYDARYDLDGRKFDGSHINVEFARGVLRGPGGVCQYCRGPPPGRCYNCGMDGHCVRDCKAADWRDKCFRSGEMGHIERSCQNSPKDLKRGRSYSRSPSPRHGKSRRRSYSRSPSPRHGKGRSRTYRQGRSHSMSSSPRHGKGRGRSYSRSPSPHHGRVPSRTYRRDYRNAGGEDLPSRRPHYSPNPRRNLPPREQAERNGSYHGGSPRRGEARGKRQ